MAGKTITCPICGKEFLSLRGRKTDTEVCRIALAAKQLQDYTTRRSNEAKGGPPLRHCNICGKPYTRRRTGCKPGQIGGTKYGSLECAAQGQQIALAKLGACVERRENVLKELGCRQNMLTWREAWLEMKKICDNPEDVSRKDELGDTFVVLQFGTLVATGLCVLTSNLYISELISEQLRLKLRTKLESLVTADIPSHPWVWPKTLEGARQRAEFCAKLAEEPEPQ